MVKTAAQYSHNPLLRPVVAATVGIWPVERCQVPATCKRSVRVTVTAVAPGANSSSFSAVKLGTDWLQLAPESRTLVSGAAHLFFFLLIASQRHSLLSSPLLFTLPPIHPLLLSSPFVPFVVL
jgi:hypothetical protein